MHSYCRRSVLQARQATRSARTAARICFSVPAVRPIYRKGVRSDFLVASYFTEPFTADRIAFFADVAQR